MLNTSFIKYRELRLVVEFAVDSQGALYSSEKTKMLLNQYGIYDLDTWEKYLESYLNKLEDLFVAEDTEEDYFEYDEVDERADKVEEISLKEITVGDDSKSEQEEDQEEDLTEFDLLVTIRILFFRRKSKTLIYFVNPFVSHDLTKIIWLNTYDFYSLLLDKINFIRLVPTYNLLNKPILSSIPYIRINYYNILKAYWEKKSKIRRNYFKYKKRRFLVRETRLMIQWYKRRMNRKIPVKKRARKRMFRFLYLLKSKRWININYLFKLMLWKTLFLQSYYSHSYLKIYLTGLFSLTVFYRGLLKKKFKKRKKFKNSIRRSIDGKIK